MGTIYCIDKFQLSISGGPADCQDRLITLILQHVTVT